MIADKQNYRLIDYKSLVIKQQTDFDLFYYIPEKDKYVLYLERNHEFEHQHLESLFDRKRSVYIKYDDLDIYRNYLADNLRWISMELDLAPEKKGESIYTISRNIMACVFDNPHDEKNLDITREIADCTKNFIIYDEIKMRRLLQMLVLEYTNHDHSVNVSWLAVKFARRQGLDQNMITNIAVGALLHDIGMYDMGKQDIISIINMDNDREALLLKHIEAGISLLEKSSSASRLELNNEVKHIIRYHHERYDGAGIPEGLCEEEIPLPTQIISIASIFNGLVTTKKDDKRINTFDALRIMKDDMSGAFNNELLSNFIRLFQGYI